MIDKGYLTICVAIMCNACSPFAYVLAQNVYEIQPKKTKEHFKSVKGKITDLHFNLNNYKDSNNTDYFIAVASSGGGYRAAYSTLGVLEALEELPSIKNNKNFLQDVDVFSSVSGSGLTIGYYLANKFSNPDYSLGSDIEQMLKKDRVTGKPNILRVDLDHMLFHNGNMHENNIDRHFKKLYKTIKGQLKLKDVFISKSSTSEPKIPFWLINTTIFQNMAGLVIMPETLIALGVPAKIAENLNASKAAVASAAYPMAIPPLKLKSNACKKACYIYLMDGGIYDNLGVISALNAIKQARQKHKILIIIDANQKSDTPFSLSETSPNPIDLMLKIPSMVTDAHAQQIKQNINVVAENTRVIIIKLSDNEKASSISTRFNSSLQEQKFLISIGKKLTLKHKQMLGR